jgi:peptidoglycan/xylan/chitin deacetylase (PgdA/CDA1 family)
MTLAGLSIDVDSVASHLEGYGFEPGAGDGSDDASSGAAYRLAIPRALELFESLGARATFFLIGREAREHPEVVRDITRRGHEVASHSMTHRLPFGNLDDEALRVELEESRKLLEDLALSPVVGFRAPSWDLSERLVEGIARAGYRYDASTYPSILLPLLRRAIARRSRSGRSCAQTRSVSRTFGPATLHTIAAGARPLVEVPMCTAPGLRLPYYQTMRFLMPGWTFAALRLLVHTRRSALTFSFHAVDFLGIDEDRLDSRIARHPGMTLSLRTKLVAAQRSVAELAPRRVLPLAELVEQHFGPWSAEGATQ